MRVQTFVGLLMATVFMATGLFAQQKEDAAKSTALAVNAPKDMDVTGTLVCLGCSLKKTEGARSECSVYGHKHGLKTDDGRFIAFLENKYSADLIKGDKYAGKKLEVHGIFHASANQLDVESFNSEGNVFTWCEDHKAMDNCASAASKK